MIIIMDTKSVIHFHFITAKTFWLFLYDEFIEVENKVNTFVVPIGHWMLPIHFGHITKESQLVNFALLLFPDNFICFVVELSIEWIIWIWDNNITAFIVVLFFFLLLFLTLFCFAMLCFLLAEVNYLHNKDRLHISQESLLTFWFD